MLALAIRNKRERKRIEKKEKRAKKREEEKQKRDSPLDLCYH